MSLKRLGMKRWLKQTKSKGLASASSASRVTSDKVEVIVRNDPRVLLQLNVTVTMGDKVIPLVFDAYERIMYGENHIKRTVEIYCNAIKEGVTM